MSCNLHVYTNPLFWKTTHASLRAVSLNRVHFSQTNHMLPLLVCNILMFSMYSICRITSWSLSWEEFLIFGRKYMVLSLTAYVLPPLVLISAQHNCLIRCIYRCTLGIMPSIILYLRRSPCVLPHLPIYLLNLLWIYTFPHMFPYLYLCIWLIQNLSNTLTALLTIFVKGSVRGWPSANIFSLL